ncbi:histamine N-methyltransferase-like [Glandiceps talaboti]
MRYVIVEHDESGVEKFKSLVESKSGDSQWMHVNFEFHITEIANYLSKVKTIDGVPSHQFDIIHSIHSVYYFPEPQSTLLDLYWMLEGCGMFFIMIDAELKTNEMAMEIKALINYPDIYFEKYNAVIKNGFFIVDEERIQHIVQTFEEFDIGKPSELRVLAIGTASGLLDEIIIDVLSRRFPKITYIVVEPDKDELQKFKDRDTSKSTQGQWQNVNMEFNLTTIEDYMEKRECAKSEEAFHIVHAIHCAYHFIDPYETVLQLYGTLEKCGMLLINLVKGPWEQTTAKVAEYFFDPRHHFIGTTIVREKLEERVKDLKITTKYRKKPIKVTGCFKEDSEEGNDILDFIVQIPDFRTTNPKHVVDDVITFMKIRCYQQSGDDMFFGADEEDLIIIKE